MPTPVGDRAKYVVAAGTNVGQQVRITENGNSGLRVQKDPGWVNGVKLVMGKVNSTLKKRGSVSSGLRAEVCVMSKPFTLVARNRVEGVTVGP